jgi:hypothetical protein
MKTFTYKWHLLYGNDRRSAGPWKLSANGTGEKWNMIQGGCVTWQVRGVKSKSKCTTLKFEVEILVILKVEVEVEACLPCLGRLKHIVQMAIGVL